MNEALKNAPAWVKLECFQTEAISLNVGNKVNVTTKSGEIIKCDRLRRGEIDATGKISAQLYTLGPPKIGYLWETIAVPEVRKQAQELAEELLK